jgi:putative flippase GtrA
MSPSIQSLFALAVAPLPPRWRPLVPQFLRFGTVGVTGFLVDTACVYALRPFVGIYAAGMLAYLVASTWAWMLNRSWTFRALSTGPAHVQWMRYLVANLAGLVINRGTFVLLVAFVPICAERPVLPVAAGAIAGMFINFGLSRVLVFRPASG